MIFTRKNINPLTKQSEIRLLSNCIFGGQNNHQSKGKLHNCKHLMDHKNIKLTVVIS